MNDPNTQYVQDQLAAGVLPTQIVQNLVSNGWQEGQATALVQQVSGVQLAVAAGPGGYTKPPIILQIMYAFAFIALLIGLLSLLAVYGALSDFDTFGFIGLGLVSIFPAILIGSFILIRKMRNGSLLALKIWTGLIALSVIASAGFGAMLAGDPALEGFLVSDTAGEAIGRSFGQSIIPILIAVYLWTKHRLYFR